MSMPWHGELPERWEAYRIKNLFSLRDERNFKPLSEVRLLSLYTAIGVKPHDEIERVAGNVAVRLVCTRLANWYLQEVLKANCCS